MDKHPSVNTSVLILSYSRDIIFESEVNKARSKTLPSEETLFSFCFLAFYEHGDEHALFPPKCRYLHFPFFSIGKFVALKLVWT